VAAATTLFQQRLSHWSAAPEIAASDDKLAETLAAHDASKGLADVLSSRAPFTRGAGFLVALPNGFIGFNANDAAATLIRRVVQGEKPEIALEWLTNLLRIPSASGIAITALWGIACDEIIELVPGLQLVPIATLPETDITAWVLRPPDHRSSGMLSSAPTAALTTAATISPLIYPADGAHPHQGDPFRLQTLLDDARLALSLCGPSHPLTAGHWFEFDDADIRSTFRSGGVSHPHIEVVPMGFKPPQQVDPAQANRVVVAFLGMPTDDRNRVRLSLSRFNQAVRRPAHGDRALDLAIALESLLVDNAGENTYKFGLRAALLLGGSLAQRRHTRAIIGALYALRSTLVHDGVLQQTVKVTGTGKRPSAEVVEEATVLAGRLLERIISMGCIPDWYECELQPESAP
jgi:hypothetical protein